VPSQAAETVVYCLTRDEELAAGLESGIDGSLAFFYNDAARLHLAVALRPPDLVVVDTDAIRPEYGDAGLGPVVEQLRDRVPGARIAVRPAFGAEWLVAAEAGSGVEMLPADRAGCVMAASLLLSDSDARAGSARTDQDDLPPPSGQ
jgi:hypothetical protein